MNMSLLIPKGDNLVTYFILPLLNMNKHTFGRSFHSSYVSESDLVYVRLRYKMSSTIYKMNENFVTEVILDDSLYCIFKIKTEYLNDLTSFKQGLYSKMSTNAKKLIYRVSTLPYNKSMSDFKMSHPILHALDSTKVLRNFLLTYLEVEELSGSGELINPPKKSWYIETILNVEI